MRRFVRPALVLLLVAGIIWGSRGFELGRYLTRDGMQALLEPAGRYGPLVFMAICILGIFMHFPEVLLVALGGMALGAPTAFACGWLACLIGATSTFLVVRYFAGDYFQRRLAARFPPLRALDERLARNGFRTVLVLRLLLFMSPPLNWTLGATRVRLPQYVAGTALGTIPGLAMTVYFAESIANRPAGGGNALRLALAAAFVVAIVVTARVASRRLLAHGAPP